jgi:hypothetical protein
MRIFLYQKYAWVPGMMRIFWHILIQEWMRWTFLKKSDQPDVEKLRTSVRNKLSHGAQGDFVKLDYKLTDISTKRRRKEIQDVLEHAGEDRQDTIARKVERLNVILGQEDIQDLNELLPCIIAAKDINQTLTVQELEAVLFLKHGESSLMPLEKQIQGQYAALLDFSNDDKTVTLRAESLIDYFRNKLHAEEDQAITGLHKSEVAIVQRFLRHVCDDELFEKFGFEEFFKRKLGKETALITVNVNDVHVRILHCFLKAICDVQTDETAPLREYAFNWLAHHLVMVNLSCAEPSGKSDIGCRLIKLFVDEEYINQW